MFGDLLISDLTWGELVLHHSQHTVRLQADQTDREDGGEVGLPGALVLKYKQSQSISVSINSSHCTANLQLLDCSLETLPGEESAPAPQFSVTNPAQAPNDQSPGH